MPPNHCDRTRPARDRGRQIILLLYLERQTAGKARVFRPSDNDDGENRIDSTAAKHTGNRNGKYDTRKCEKHIRQTHDDIVHLTADIGRDHTDQGAKPTGDNHNDQSHRNGDARSIEDARKDISSKFIRAEVVLGRGREKGVLNLRLIRIIR